MMASTGHSWEGEPVRLPSTPSIATLLSPGVNLVHVRRLLRLGIILRWVAIAFAGLAGVLTAKPPPLLFYLMLAALIYNLAVMVAAGQATEAGARRLALATTVIDQFFDLGFITIYAGALPNGEQVAPYIVGLIEAVAYFGVAGGILQNRHATGNRLPRGGEHDIEAIPLGLDLGAAQRRDLTSDDRSICLEELGRRLVTGALDEARVVPQVGKEECAGRFRDLRHTLTIPPRRWPLVERILCWFHPSVDARVAATELSSGCATSPNEEGQ